MICARKKYQPQNHRSCYSHIFPLLSLLTCIFLMIRTYNLHQNLLTTFENSSLKTMIVYGGENKYMKHIVMNCTYESFDDPIYKVLWFSGQNIRESYRKLNIITRCFDPYILIKQTQSEALDYILNHIDIEFMPYLCSIYPQICHNTKQDSSNSLVLFDFNKHALVVFHKKVIEPAKKMTDINDIALFIDNISINPNLIFDSPSSPSSPSSRTINIINQENENIWFHLFKTKIIVNTLDFITGNNATPLLDIQSQMSDLLNRVKFEIKKTMNDLDTKSSEIKLNINKKTNEANLILSKIIAYISSLVVIYSIAGPCFTYTVFFYYHYFVSECLFLIE